MSTSPRFDATPMKDGGMTVTMNGKFRRLLGNVADAVARSSETGQPMQLPLPFKTDARVFRAFATAAGVAPAVPSTVPAPPRPSWFAKLANFVRGHGY